MRNNLLSAGKILVFMVRDLKKFWKHWSELPKILTLWIKFTTLGLIMTTFEASVIFRATCFIYEINQVWQGKQVTIPGMAYSLQVMCWKRPIANSVFTLCTTAQSISDYFSFVKICRNINNLLLMMFCF